MAALYQSLPLRQDQDIRLLRLMPANDGRCLAAKLDVVSLNDLPKYIALSYAWGPPSLDSILTCNGVTLRINF